MMLESLYTASVISQHVIAGGVAGSAIGRPYLDPGTGSMIVQIAIGALVGGLVGAKLVWKRITGSLARLSGRTSRLERIDH